MNIYADLVTTTDYVLANCSHNVSCYIYWYSFKASIDTEASMCIHSFDSLFSLQLIHSSYSEMCNKCILMCSMDKSILCHDATWRNNCFIKKIIDFCTYLQFPATQLAVSHFSLLKSDLHLEVELGIHSQVLYLYVKFGLHLLVQSHLHVFGL